jgi:hypothetical protein
VPSVTQSSAWRNQQAKKSGHIKCPPTSSFRITHFYRHIIKAPALPADAQILLR